MVKDFKYIIKRILIGTGIAILLMLFKGNLAFDVHAMSCDTNYSETIHALPNTISTHTYTTTSEDFIKFEINLSTPLTFNLRSGYDYAIINIPYLLSESFTNTYSNNANTETLSYLPVYKGGSNGGTWFFCNANTSRSACKISGIKNGSTQKFSGFALYLPSSYYNFNSASGSLTLFDYWTIDYYKCDDNSDISNAIDENTQAQQDTNDTLNDDSIDDNKTSSSIDNMQGKVATNGSISQLLTLPITLYQNILNSLNGSCSSFNLGSLFGSNLTMPCINLENLLGSTLFGIIDVLISGLFILSFRKKMVDIFNHMTSLNDRGNELE